MRSNLGKIRLLSVLNVIAWAFLVIAWLCYYDLPQNEVNLALKWSVYGLYMITAAGAYLGAAYIIRSSELSGDDADCSRFAQKLKKLGVGLEDIGIFGIGIGAIVGSYFWGLASPGFFVCMATLVTWGLFVLLLLQAKNPSKTPFLDTHGNRDHADVVKIHIQK